MTQTGQRYPIPLNFGGGSSTTTPGTAVPSGPAGGDLTGTYPDPTLVNVATPGSYARVTIDAKGRVLSGGALVFGDLPDGEESITLNLGLAQAGDFFEGTIAPGRLFAFLRSVASTPVWIRIYATDADRTADASRLITDDATTPIGLELIHNPTLEWRTNPVLLANQDDTRVDLLYYRIDVLEITAGFNEVFRDDFELASPPVALKRLEDHVPTAPSLALTAWEEPPIGGTFESDALLIESPADPTGLLPGAVNGDGNAGIARLNADVNHLQVQIAADLQRIGGSGGQPFSLCLGVTNEDWGPGSAADSPGEGRDAMYFARLRIDGDDNTFVGIFTDPDSSAGGDTLVADDSQADFPKDTNRRFIFEIDAGMLSVYTATYGTGASPLLRAQIALPAAPDASHLRVGMYMRSGAPWNVAGFSVLLREEDVTVTLSGVKVEA